MQSTGRLDVVSEEDRGAFAPEGLAEPSPTSVLAFADPIYDATGEDPDGFEHGDERRGTISGEGLSGFGGFTWWQVHLVSDDGESSIDAEGRLANHPDGRPGPGTLTVTAAVGKWQDVRRLVVTAKNPRRWKSA